MANTTNFGWETPDDTDLVKDGAAAIRTLGSAIDTSLVDLKGGTTGQVLAKASNTDMDFTWSAADPLSILDAKGDLISATAADTPARLAVGANNTVLTADSSTATGLKWASPSVAANWTLLNAGGTALTGAATITVSGISGADKIMVLVSGASSASASNAIALRFNSDTASNYYQFGTRIAGLSTYSAGIVQNIGGQASLIQLADFSTNAGSTGEGFCLLSGCNSSGVKIFNCGGGATISSGNSQATYVGGGYYNSSSTISSVSILTLGGNWDAGTVFVYTSA